MSAKFLNYSRKEESDPTLPKEESIWHKVDSVGSSCSSPACSATRNSIAASTSPLTWTKTCQNMKSATTSN